MTRIAQCGTRSGYLKHRREETEPCEPCRKANREYQKAWDAAYRDGQRKEPAPATQRERLTRITHDAWLRERRKRGVPPEGLAREEAA